MTGATASTRSASRTTIHAIKPLPFALPHQYYAETDQENSSPADRGDALAQEQAAAVGPGSVAESRNRYDKADVFHGEHRQHSKKTNAHQRKAEPHPSHLHRPAKNAQQRERPEILHFADDFHGARDAKFPGSAAQNNERKQNPFQPHQRRSVVFRAVFPTKRTPTQIVAIPIHRQVLTNSPSKKWPIRATMA